VVAAVALLGMQEIAHFVSVVASQRNDEYYESQKSGQESCQPTVEKGTGETELGGKKLCWSTVGKAVV